MSGDVILVPGLWMPSAAMALIAARLRSAGFRPRAFGYGGRGALAANIERLLGFMRAHGDERPAHASL